MVVCCKRKIVASKSKGNELMHKTICIKYNIFRGSFAIRFDIQHGNWPVWDETGLLGENPHRSRKESTKFV